MKQLFTNNELNIANSNNTLPLICHYCNKPFLLTKKRILDSLNSNKHDKSIYCSLKCYGLSIRTKVKLSCTTCNKEIEKIPSQIKKSKSGKHFCSRSCAITYHNLHKNRGTRKSKLELYLEKELTTSYPELTMLFNDKNKINSELDIYIPSLNLAFELNGIFHYEPIYGDDKLSQIQNNDNRKFQACLEQKIELCIIDTSKQKHFTEKSSKLYLDIITTIINGKIN